MSAPGSTLPLNPPTAVSNTVAPAGAKRTLAHRRAIAIEAFRRDDGLFELEAHLTDTKTRDVELATGTRTQGSPIHDLTVTVTVDRSFTVVGAGARMAATPYPGFCEAGEARYAGLVGMNLVKGFRRAVREKFGGTAGCTHLTELAQVLPTAAIQAFGSEYKASQKSKEPAEDAHEKGDSKESSNSSGSSSQPFYVDGCHSLDARGPAVQKYYPKWYTGVPVAGSTALAGAPAEEPQKKAA
jgi:hypothetical protein